MRKLTLTDLNQVSSKKENQISIESFIKLSNTWIKPSEIKRIDWNISIEAKEIGNINLLAVVGTRVVCVNHSFFLDQNDPNYESDIAILKEAFEE